jgi:AraC family transcriptional regulator
MLCDYMPEGGVPDDFTRLSVSPYTWAIFPVNEKDSSRSVGEQIQDIWKRLYPVWFPTSGYQLADGLEFEMYWDKGEGIYRAEAWVPVVKK